MRSDFAVMICSHGRAETLTTYDMLRRQGYTGKIIVVIDDEDDQRDAYESRFEWVEVFCKEEYYKSSDGVIQGKQKGILYARNACYDIAVRNGLKFFTEFDDDFSGIDCRYFDGEKLKSYKVENLDELFTQILDMFEHEKVVSVSLLTQGDYIGGGPNAKGIAGVTRICNQAFFLMTERRIDFISSMNEDMCSALTYGMRGRLFLGLNGTMLEAEPIANNKMGNGMTEFYKKLAPFARAFTAVIVRPDCALSEPVDKKDSFRIKVKTWDIAVPKILNERYKKNA